MKEEKRKIIKKKIGELAHVDAHYLPQGIVKGYEHQRLFLVAVLDDCSRLCFAEVVTNLRALSVMFGVLKCLNYLVNNYGVKFKELMTDNGPEFGRKSTNQTKKAQHPFERMLIELGIKHRYTRPFRPQTNGKIERFWRTLEDDLLGDYVFDSLEHLKQELIDYLLYYNEHRPQQTLAGKSPLLFSKFCPRIS